MKNGDLYEILGISRDATEKEIQRAFRKLALKFHPDKNPDDPKATEKFKEVSEAFEILSDPEKRKAYDQGGMTGVYDTGFEGFTSNEEIYSRYGDIFGDLFGSRVHRHRPGPQRGHDLRFMLTLSFTEAALGVKREIELSVPDVCPDCQGSGTADGKPVEPCPDCHGAGQVSQQGRQQGGFFSVSSACPLCGGTGRESGQSCAKCGGEGRLQKQTRISIDIPPGIDTGNVLRLSGQGEAGRGGGSKGDLLIEVEVRPHPSFTRTDKNIHSDVKVPVATALLGGKVEVPTLKGSVMLSVPPGTSSDQILRIRGQGIPAKDGAGDHLVRAVITVPKELSDQAKEALQAHLT